MTLPVAGSWAGSPGSIGLQVGIKPSLYRSLGFHEDEVSRSRGSLMGKAQPRAGRARDERVHKGGEVTGTMSLKLGLEPARACTGPSVPARLYYSARGCTDA